MEFIRFVQSFSGPFLDRFFILITQLGEVNFLLFTIALVFWCIHKPFGYRLAFACLIGGYINTILKHMFQVARPVGAEGIRSLRLYTAQGYSFPSGHTQSAASYWAVVMVEIGKPIVTYLGSIAILLVALSRVYLGVHTLADVAVGIAVGIGWAFLSNHILTRIEASGKPQWIFLYCIPVAAGLFWLYDHIYYKIAGTMLSLVLGYYLETTYIRFEPKAPLLLQVLKFTIGMAVLLLLQTGIEALLPIAPISDLIRTFVMGLWLMVFAPLLFLQLGRLKPFQKGAAPGA